MSPALILAAIEAFASLVKEGLSLYQDSQAGTLSDAELDSKWAEALKANAAADAIYNAAVAAYQARHPSKS